MTFEVGFSDKPHFYEVLKTGIKTGAQAVSTLTPLAVKVGTYAGVVTSAVASVHHFVGGLRGVVKELGTLVLLPDWLLALNTLVNSPGPFSEGEKQQKGWIEGIKGGLNECIAVVTLGAAPAEVIKNLETLDTVLKMVGFEEGKEVFGEGWEEISKEWNFPFEILTPSFRVTALAKALQDWLQLPEMITKEKLKDARIEVTRRVVELSRSVLKIYLVAYPYFAEALGIKEESAKEGEEEKDLIKTTLNLLALVSATILLYQFQKKMRTHPAEAGKAKKETVKKPETVKAGAVKKKRKRKKTKRKKKPTEKVVEPQPPKATMQPQQEIQKEEGEGWTVVKKRRDRKKAA